MKLNESIIKIRVDLQKSKLKKSGKNKYAGFEYYELSDFLPQLNELMLKEGVNDIVSIENNEATLTLTKGEEKNIYKIPFVLFETPLTKEGKPSMQDIQYLGALNTYYKRYLYLNAFGITDGEVIESIDTTDGVVVEKPKPTPKPTPKKEAPKEVISELMTVETKKELATKIKELGLVPAEVIADIAKDVLDCEVVEIKENDKEKILEYIENNFME